MSTRITPAKLEDLLSLFEDTLQPEDIMYAKVASQASRSITRERLRLDLNQKEFAELLNATQSLVSRWESGKYNFSLKKLSEISVSLDMELHIYMTPRYSKSEINAYSYHCTTWNLAEPIKKTKPGYLLFTPSKPQTFNNFSKPKEVISC